MTFQPPFATISTVLMDFLARLAGLLRREGTLLARSLAELNSDRGLWGDIPGAD